MEKKYGAIELFSEKTGAIVKIIRFQDRKEFLEFLISFRKMRYLGYNWRYKEKKKIKTDEL